MAFVKGQSGNPAGRAPRATEEKYQKAIAAAIGTKEMKELAQAMYEKGRAGDVAAVRVLWEWLAPKPREIDLNVSGSLAIVKGYAEISPDEWPGLPDPVPPADVAG